MADYENNNQIAQVAATKKQNNRASFATWSANKPHRLFPCVCVVVELKQLSFIWLKFDKKKDKTQREEEPQTQKGMQLVLFRVKIIFQIVYR